jgi:acyl-CoA thioester hydrolase
MKIQIYYEDTDAGGIVYHPNYLHFCDRARSDYFFQKDMLPLIDGAHFVVRKINCDFISSAKFGDMIEVTTKITKFKGSCFELLHEIYRKKELLFTANVLLVLVGNGKVKRLTKDIQDFLNSFFY